MIFKQFRDPVSDTLTYLLAKSKGAEALIIDPVADQVEEYIKFIDEMELKLVKVMDTHIHADHVTGMGKLRDRYNCMTIMGKESDIDLVSVRLSDGDLVKVDGITLKAMHTPGHTSESYCYYMDGMVFTGDTLFIRGSGRTDFQNGSAELQYESIYNKLFSLPDNTLVFPGHDYKGENVSTIGLEKAHNPRLANKTKEEYVELMNNLNLAYPKLMDVAVPANLSNGENLKSSLKPEAVINPKNAFENLYKNDKYFFIDLREPEEIEKTGIISGSINVPFQKLEEELNNPKSNLHLSLGDGAIPVFYCGYGERSALAIKILLNRGHSGVHHIEGGIDAWIKENEGQSIEHYNTSNS
jgi:glyoxylase-like metal-dependent hydrolase (beta-lactamase superfamily II)/rhodanese-related sulfurtransferase